jgi:citronellol/citronellal dehydrogenase
MADLHGKVVLITGASRGIGKAIGLRAARDGARVAVIAKTETPHPKLPGTVHSAVAEMQAAGGEALACVADIRDHEQIQVAVDHAVARFGGIDILVNNASAIQLTDTLQTPARRFDLLHQVNVRATFLTTQACVPHLSAATNPHILNLAPPLRSTLQARWFKDHLAYTMAKYGMSLCVLGMAAEFADLGIAVNALWPRTIIATAAVRNLLGGEAAIQRCRTPEIVADAAHAILLRDSRTCTGEFFLDEDVLRAAGHTDFDGYAVTPGADPLPDLFVDTA